MLVQVSKVSMAGATCTCSCGLAGMPFTISLPLCLTPFLRLEDALYTCSTSCIHARQAQGGRSRMVSPGTVGLTKQMSGALLCFVKQEVGAASANELRVFLADSPL